MLTPNAFSILRAISGETAALPIDEVRKGRPAHAQYLGRPRDGQAQLVQDLLADEDAGMGRPHADLHGFLAHQW